jgi:hypothetical protein
MHSCRARRSGHLWDQSKTMPLGSCIQSSNPDAATRGERIVPALVHAALKCTCGRGYHPLIEIDIRVDQLNMPR